MFPKMNEEEWIIYRNIGAYSQVLACNFNGYQYPDVYYMRTLRNGGRNEFIFAFLGI